MHRLPPSSLRAHLVALAALTFGFVASCTAILGNDFTTSGAGASGVGGHGTGANGTGGNATGGVLNCGNGQLDDFEVCDGDCPTECIDSDFCTDDHMLGSPATCDVLCPLSPINTCVDNDGCCPGGCYNSIDNDCLMHVGIVSSDGNGAPGVKAALEGTGVFGIVDIRDTNATVPDVAELLTFDAVLVFTNYQGFADPAALGDALASYEEQGGRVVVANGANCTTYALGGRFVSEGFLTIDIGAINPNLEQLGTIDSPNTPLLNNVGPFETPAHCAGETAAGAVTVASYVTSFDPIIAYRWMGNRRRVDLNLFPTSAPVELLTNALLFQ